MAVVLMLGLLWSESLLGLDPGRLRAEPWRLATWVLAQTGWLPAVGNAVGLAVGLTMAIRCCGGWTGWAGLLGAIVIPAMWSWYDLEPGELLTGASTALYGALGMGLVAWFRVRHELTYARRIDWMAGFATLGLVGLALAVPVLTEAPSRWIHVIAFTWGALLLSAVPRDWDASAHPLTETGSLAPIPPSDRTPT